MQKLLISLAMLAGIAGVSEVGAVEVSNDWRLNDWRLNDWRLNDWRLNDWRLNDWRLNDWRLNGVAAHGTGRAGSAEGYAGMWSNLAVAEVTVRVPAAN